ncbi:hypothetical protein ZIOFF_068167 [Zingiber officinale]|uniref:Uncharacterized protein n=1 Tax=Zingiber officinale TaxID=94328 RepID=A0A8J5ERN4_ZINOF|nr:hypothetical protein ZIOFF_068167 [Zingiber officinale]
MPPSSDTSHFPPLSTPAPKTQEVPLLSPHAPYKVRLSSYAAVLRPASPRAIKKSFVDVGEDFKQTTVYNNKPGIFYSEEEAAGMAEPYCYSLIGKFSGQRPSYVVVLQSFKNLGLSNLPINMFNKNSLFSTARIVGKPIKLDEAMADGSRLFMARVCVEIDLLKLKECYSNGNRPKPMWNSEKRNYTNAGGDLRVVLNRRIAMGKEKEVVSAQIETREEGLHRTVTEKPIWVQKKGNSGGQGVVNNKGCVVENSFNLLSELEKEEEGDIEGFVEPAGNEEGPGIDCNVEIRKVQNSMEALNSWNLEIEEYEFKTEGAEVSNQGVQISKKNVQGSLPSTEHSAPVGGSSPSAGNSAGLAGVSKIHGEIRATEAIVPRAESSMVAGVIHLNVAGSTMAMGTGMILGEQVGHCTLSQMQGEFEGTEVSKSFVEEVETDGDEDVHLQRASLPMVPNMVVTAVYAKCTRVERTILWEKLLEAKPDGGEFLVSPGGGITVVYAKCTRVERVILWDKLLEAKPNGGDFEHAQTNGKIWKRLDHVLIFPLWNTHEFSVHVEHLSRAAFDHCPLLITFPNFSKPVASFRFQNFWIKHHNSLLAYCSTKLDAAFGGIHDNVRKAEENFAVSEKIFDVNPFEKATVRWVGEGEKNTKFFHGLVQRRRMTNKIFRIWEEGVCLDKLELIYASGADFFEKLLTVEEFNCDSRNLDHIPSLITPRDNSALLEMPTIEEVKQVIGDMRKDSAAKPDEFSVEFYVACWEIIKEDVYGVVLDFFQGGSFPKGMVATTIVLIPKVENA